MLIYHNDMDADATESQAPAQGKPKIRPATNAVRWESLWAWLLAPPDVAPVEEKTEGEAKANYQRELEDEN